MAKRPRRCPYCRRPNSTGEPCDPSCPPRQPTPGHLAYAAHCRTIYGVYAHDDDFHDLSWGQQAAWEAAAQAVLADFQQRLAQAWEQEQKSKETPTP